MRQKGLKIILLIITLMSCGGLYSQGDKNKWCLDSVEVQQVRKDYEKLEFLEFKDSVRDIQDLKVKEREDYREEKIHNLQVELLNKDSQIELFKQREAKLELIPALRWAGFHLGLTAAYPFDDATITQQTVIAGMKFDVTATARVLILGKITGMLQAGVPLRGEKFYLKAGAEWRLF